LSLGINALALVINGKGLSAKVLRANRSNLLLLGQLFSVDQHHFSVDEKGLQGCFDAG
jgi:hypothetical protein